MSKKVRKEFWVDFMNNKIAVQCETEVQCVKFVDEIIENISSGDERFSEMIFRASKDVCISFFQSCGHGWEFCDRDYYESTGWEVVEFDDILEKDTDCIEMSKAESGIYGKSIVVCGGKISAVIGTSKGVDKPHVVLGLLELDEQMGVGESRDITKPQNDPQTLIFFDNIKSIEVVEDYLKHAKAELMQQIVEQQQ